MTGKEAIIHYLGTHNSFCAPDVAALLEIIKPSSL